MAVTQKRDIIQSMKNRSKALLIDLLGFTLILVAIPIGWLPGPGGIPLIILGLSLLATNHEWAERWIDKLKDEVEKASKRVSEADPVTKWAIDIFAAVALGGSLYLVMTTSRLSVLLWAASFAIMGVTLLATNQDRYKVIWRKLKRKR